MNQTLPRTVAVAVLVGGAFVLGHALAPARAAELHAQGRGSRPPLGSRDPAPRKPTAPLVYGGDSGQSASANGILAVTGSYGVGTSVLYVIDTERRQLAVYEARGGSPGSRRVVLVGARRIDLDLQLESYNDDSDWSYDRLRDKFAERGLVPKARSDGGAEPPAAGSSDRRSPPPKK